MITLEKVCFAYEHEVALRYVNLHIEKGESLVIQGPNGCGKSTLIKLLNGIIFPSEGHYLYKGHEITEKALKDRQFAKWFHQQMGYVFQNADTQLFCGSVEELLKESDVAVICLPVPTIIEYIQKYAPAMKEENVVVTDIGSVKGKSGVVRGNPFCRQSPDGRHREIRSRGDGAGDLRQCDGFHRSAVPTGS